MPAHALRPEPGWTVLDACAAPGNKTTHLAGAAADPTTRHPALGESHYMQLAEGVNQQARYGCMCQCWWASCDDRPSHNNPMGPWSVPAP